MDELVFRSLVGRDNSNNNNSLNLYAATIPICRVVLTNTLTYTVNYQKKNVSPHPQKISGTAKVNLQEREILSPGSLAENMNSIMQTI